ncbi:putative alpha beta-hydrolase [Rosellinia necatrix]|uniref:Putative alpha beta-hydrolase n=1 Tax=Rosellinia necatrix TaxID=77044 RepID=A0A1W2TAF7_ROSNE|nr:putative alpha beta-hydrolase [Rosellinia necatrix]
MEAKTSEGWHTTADGVKLFTKSWRPINPASASVVFLHGFSDHCVRFTDLFQNLVAYGIEVHAFDQRGWGRSVTRKSDRGMTGPTTQVLEDITGFLETLLPSPIPLFLMGHSMGGQEALTYATQGPQHIKQQIRGFLAEAPHVKLYGSGEPWWLTVMAARIASQVLPGWQIVSRLDPKYMCHDETTRSLWPADELCHDTGTLEGIVGMLDRGKELQSGQPEIYDYDGLSIAAFHGTGDMVCDSKVTAKYMEDLPIKDKTLFLYEGVYHCIHLEPEADKRKFTKDAAEWILERI